MYVVLGFTGINSLADTTEPSVGIFSVPEDVSTYLFLVTISLLKRFFEGLPNTGVYSKTFTVRAFSLINVPLAASLNASPAVVNVLLSITLISTTSEGSFPSPAFAIIPLILPSVCANCAVVSFFKSAILVFKPLMSIPFWLKSDKMPVIVMLVS